MKISELQPKQGNVDLVVNVFEKFGRKGRVCNVKVEDDSGSIKLTLWNEDIDRINVGDQLHIKNGYVNEWQGEKQLTTGKFGTLEKLDKKDEVEEELKELEEEDKELDDLDKLEEETEKTIDNNDKLEEEIKEVVEDEKEFEEVEKEVDEVEDLKENIDGAVTLDELEEVETLDELPSKEPEEPSLEEDLTEDEIVEEEVVEDEEKK